MNSNKTIIGHISSEVAELNIDVYEGEPIYLSDTAIDHIRETHSDAYMKYFEDIQEIIRHPDYIGVAGAYAPSIEYVKTYVTNGENVNIAVRASKGGTLYLRSMFLIEDGRIEDYLRKGKLRKTKDST